MHLSAKKEAQACGQCPRPTLAHPLLRAWRASRRPLTADCHLTPITPAPPPGSVYPSGRKIRYPPPPPPGPEQAALARRPCALQGACAEPRVVVPVSRRGHPSSGPISRAPPAPLPGWDLCLPGANPGPGTQWECGESREGVFPEERLAGPGPGAADQGLRVRPDRPRSGGRAPVSGQSGRTDSSPRPPPDQETVCLPLI